MGNDENKNETPDEIKTATPVIPAWTKEDFNTPAVYDWLWKEEEKGGFDYQLKFSKAQDLAKSLHVTRFMKLWTAYRIDKNKEKQQTTLGANTTHFANQPAELDCRYYTCYDDGVYYINGMGQAINVIIHPLMPVMWIVNIDTQEVKIMLAYSDGKGGELRTKIVSKGVISSAQKITALSETELAITSENAKEVVKYLSNLIYWNRDSIPTQKSVSHLGWIHDGSFVPYADGIEYDGNSVENQKMFNAFHEHGSRDVWMKIALDTRKGVSVPARIALAGAFTAPLVSKFNALPFIIHFFGGSGMGKSVALMLSASVWAEPTVGGAYIQTFQATKVAQEKIASFCCNMPMYLDELQMIADRKLFDDIIYMLCEGSSKSRGTNDGGLQTKQERSNCILTTGEFPIIKSNSGGGAAARVIEVDYGGIPFFTDSRNVAETLKENYGFAGREFIEAICQPENMEKLRAYQNEYYNELSKHDIHPKQILSASLLLAADRMSDEAIFHDGNSLTVEDVLPYLVTNRQADANERCYNWLNGFIAANPKRFEVADNNGELWGVREEKEVYIIRTVFDRILTDNGFSPTTFLNWAKQNGKISYYEQTKTNKRLTKQKSINGHYITCVVLIPDETSPPKDDDDEPLPF